MDISENTIVTSIDQLVDYYKGLIDKKNLYIGIEWERSGVYRDSLEPVHYEGERGYLVILQKLVSEVGWEIIEGDENYIFELKRGEARVTIEPDGRLELAGSPRRNLHDLGREFRIHAEEVKEVSNYFNIGWLPLGWQPFHSDKEIKLIKKKRYEIIKGLSDNKWLESTMKRNNGLTVNFGYTDEKNAIVKARTAFRIMPIVGAMFASSPFDTGKLSGIYDMRRLCIKKYAPGRNLIPENIFDESFSYRSWIEYYANIPLFVLVNKNKEMIHPKNMNFKDWMKKGYEGLYPTIKEFDKHIKNTWADIRLRPKYLEYRVADTVPLRMSMSVPALIKGLVFDSNNWDAIEEITKDWSYQDIVDADERAWEKGLQTEIKGRTLLSYAQELILLANDSLHSFGKKAGIGVHEDESVFLAPLKEQIYIKEKSIAEELVELWGGKWNKVPRKLLEWCEG